MLTSTQAIAAARELKGQFSDHDALDLRRRIRQRQVPVNWEALGLEEGWKDIAPYQSDVPEQEAHRYANAIASAEPEVAVFVAESEKTSKQKIGERLESFYDAAVHALLDPEEYLRCLYQAAEGFGVGRFDLKPQFWHGVPKRGDLEAEPYNALVENHRKAIGLPFDFVSPDPRTFFYEENKKREITVGCEWGDRKASVVNEVYDEIKKAKGDEAYLSPAVPEDTGALGGAKMVKFVVVRTPEVIYHLLPEEGGGKGGKVLWDGPNIFAPSTGYILWRGLPGGYAEMDERYLPFIMNSLVNSQHLNLLMTMQFNFALLSSRVWTEAIPEARGTPRIVGREVTSAAKGLDKTKKARTGNVVADLEEGRIARWREVSGDVRMSIDYLRELDAIYRFPEALAPESSSGESGRDTIRRQEASARLLRQAFDARKQAVEEVVRVMRTTLFGHKPFLADGRMVYLQHLVEGRGDEGTLRKQDVISLSGEDNIPHEVQITVATSTQAAQLALNDEAIRLEGRLSQETLFQDYMKIKNIPLERKRLTDDILRRATYEVTIQRAVTEAAAAIAARTPPGAAAVLPPTETPGAGAGGNGRVPGPVTSAQPTPAQPEDVGTMMGSEQGGVEPMMEGAQP